MPPIPKNVTFVTFDVYGTLIDWETGIYDAFAKEAARDEIELDRNVLIPMFHEIEREIEAGSYELYAEVLRRTALEIAKRLEWDLEPSRSGFLPESVQRWLPFRETNPQLVKLAKKYKLGLLSNIDDKLLGQTRRHIPTDFDLVVTAQQVRSYKPEPAHFTECATADRRQAGMGPRGGQPLPRRGAVHQSPGPRDLGQPPQREARLLPEEADRRGAEPQRGGQAARRHLSRRVRAQALHPDVLLVTSAVLALNCVVVRAELEEPAGEAEVFVIDSPVLPEELESLPGLLEQAGFPEPSGLLATHGDWDHLLGRLAFPGLALGMRGEHRRAPRSAGRARPSAALRQFDEELMIERPAPLALGSLQALPVPGRLRHRRPGARAAPDRGAHRGRDGAPDRRGRGCWSSATTSPRSRSRPCTRTAASTAYAETLERLRPLVERCEHVVTGHGPPMDRERALRLLEEDAAYLRAAARAGRRAHLPDGRRGAAQRRLHEQNAVLTG